MRAQLDDKIRVIINADVPQGMNGDSESGSLFRMKIFCMSVRHK